MGKDANSAKNSHIDIAVFHRSSSGKSRLSAAFACQISLEKRTLGMALGLGAPGQILLEFGLFGHDLGVTAQAVVVLEGLLVVNNIVQALFALFAGQVVMATGAAALGEAVLAVHLVVAGNAFQLGVDGMGEHDGLLRTLEFQGFVRGRRSGHTGQRQRKKHDTRENQRFLHGRPPLMMRTADEN